MTTRTLLAAVAIAAIAMTGCATNPVTGKATWSR